MKLCSGCETEKPYSDFHKSSANKDGYMSRCKECRKKVSSQHYQANKERIKSRTAQYYVDNKPKISVVRKKYDEERREQLEAYRKDYYKKNRARRIQQAQEYYEEHKPAVLERRKVHYQENREQELADARQWAKKNRNTVRAIKRRHRAKLAGAEGSHTAAEWLALAEKYDHRCLACGIQLSIDELTVDHIVPLSKGGTDNIDNLQPLCQSCNTRKRDKTIDYREAWQRSKFTGWMNL